MSYVSTNTKTVLYSLKKTFFAEEKAVKVLRHIILARALEQKCFKLLRQNRGTTFFLSAEGHELIGAVSAENVLKGVDFCYPYHRDRAFVLSLGAPLVDLIGSFLAREVPHHSGGRMMPDHFSDKSLNIACQSSCIGSQLLQAVGTAKAIKLRKESAIVYVSVGDGGTSQGDFHEALNFSSIHRLPILFVVQDNGWAISTPISEQTAGGNIAHIAKGYDGLTVYETDGSDFIETDRVMRQAVEAARGSKPSLVVAKVVRLGAHSASDDQTKYKSREIIEDERKRDPLPRLEKMLLEEGLISISDLEEMKARAREDVEKAAEIAEKIPFIEKDRAADSVFVPFSLENKIDISGEKATFLEAIKEALREEMALDDKVYVFGEDVAKEKGGVFGATRDLTALFGQDRCFNTPLAESTIVGTAIGMAFYGLKPVAEIQYADYIWTGMNQLINELPSIYYRSNGEWNMPVVVRIPYGGYIQGGPYHSQSPEAVFCHTPGLKVVVPSTAQDAKALLKRAIRDPNPVIFLEHKGLYRHPWAMGQLSDAILDFGKASIVREGKGVTCIAWGMMVHFALEAAKKFDEIEVIDLRTLVPLDMETILASAKKTGKVLIVHEDIQTGGFGAEIFSRIVESGIGAEVKRVGAKYAPIPYSKTLEDAILPQIADIEKALSSLI